MEKRSPRHEPWYSLVFMTEEKGKNKQKRQWEEERKQHQGIDLLTQLTATESKIFELGSKGIRDASF